MITIYGTEQCIFCQKAKDIARDYGIFLTFKDITEEKYFNELNSKIEDFKTIPQIWVYNKYVGGYNGLLKEIEETNIGNYGQGDL